MEQILYRTLLLDFYGELLTDRQREMLEMHYLNDLTLSEIGQNYGVSRQSVNYMLKRAERTLLEYERKLRLIEDYQAETRRKRALLEIIDGIIDGGGGCREIFELKRIVAE